MQIFGLDIRLASRAKDLQSVDSSRGWFPLIREPFSGAWQRNAEESVESVLSYGPVFACQTLIASDVAKCRLRLVEQDANGIWTEVSSASPFWPVLRKPNHFQTRIQFFENWVLSKLSWGNTYALKARDARGVVTALFILDPQRTRPLVSDEGEIYYELRKDPLSRQVQDTIIVPAREIIHDRFNCLFHPLVGLSPLFAATLAASQGLKIQRQATSFWQNAARPSGVLLAPGDISQATADQLASAWSTNFSGDNVAKIAVLSDNMKYQQLSMSSVDAQLVEQLGLSAKQVAAAYHVPAHMIGASEPPSYNNIEALSQAYYSQCLQRHLEDAEICLDEGLGLTQVQGKALGTEFDLTDLLRMDTATQVKTEGEAVQRGIKSPNEARKTLNLPPTDGGETPYMQEQNWPLQMLAGRELPTETPTEPEPLPGVPANDVIEANFVPSYLKHLSEALDAA